MLENNVKTVSEEKNPETYLFKENNGNGRIFHSVR